MMHPEAIAVINSKAEQLYQGLERHPIIIPTGDEIPQSQANSTGVITHNISQCEILGPTLVRRLTPEKELASIFLKGPSEMLGYFGTTITEFVGFIATCSRNNDLKNRFTQGDLEAGFLAWSSAKSQLGESRNFLDFLESGPDKSNGVHQIYLPIFELMISEPFAVSGVQFVPMSPLLIAEWRTKAIQANPERAALLNDRFDKKFMASQGYGALKITVTGTRDKAEKEARYLGEKITDLLRIFVQPPLLPDSVSAVSLRGMERIPTYLTITCSNGNGPLVNEGLVHMPPPTPVINVEMLQQISKAGFGLVVAWLLARQRTDLQERILSALALYSRAAATQNIEDKLVYILASLESLLLRDTNESIQQNLGERLAFFSADTGPERQGIVANVKAVYGLRSKFVHHGLPPTDTTPLKAFLMTTFCFYLLVVGRSAAFASKDALLKAIDEIKFGTKSFGDIYPDPG